MPTRRPGSTSRSSGVRRAGRPTASRSGSCCASSPRRSRSRAATRSRASSSAGTNWSKRTASLRARDTGEREELECDLILRSVGYTGHPDRAASPSTRSAAPILNEHGRVLEEPRRRPPDRPLHGRLDQAWPLRRDRHQQEGCARRPSPTCSKTSPPATCSTRAHPDPNAIEALLEERGAHYVSFSGWEKIDQAEVGRGEPHGRPRVKFVRIDEMLETAAEQAEAAAAAKSGS